MANLPENTLANEFYLRQKINGYPGVVTEMETFINEWNLTQFLHLSKHHWKRAVKEVLYKKNRDELLNWIQNYKKINHNTCSKEKFEMKSYFKTMNIEQSRLYFKIQNFITPTIRLNFKSDRKFASEKWLCVDCMSEGEGSEPDRVTIEISSRKLTGFPDSQEHQILHCQANEDLRRGKDIKGNENDCVAFFQQLIQRRSNKLI